MTLRGCGSITAESSEPLHIYVSAATPTDLASARNLAQVRRLASWPVGLLACWHAGPLASWRIHDAALMLVDSQPVLLPWSHAATACL